MTFLADIPHAREGARDSIASVTSYYAIDNNLTLKEAALKNGVSEELFDRAVVPINMTRPDGAAPKATAKRASTAKKPAAKSTTGRKKS